MGQRLHIRLFKYEFLAACFALSLLACANPTGVSTRLQVCTKPDTLHITIYGDSTIMVIENCW